MNFYKHHIGDYDADTAHLSWLEDAAYRRLLCLYYRREQPIPADLAQACRLVRATSKQEREAVESVLREFFSLEADGWRQVRCDGEIDAAQVKANSNRVNGKSGGRPRKAETTEDPPPKPNGNRHETEQKPNGFSLGSKQEPMNNLLQTPDSRLQKYPPTPKGAVHELTPGFEAWWAAYPRKVAKPSAARAFARLRPDEATQHRMLSALERQRCSEQWAKDGGQFIPHPATWLNQRRWEDEAAAAPSADALWAGAR